MAALVFGEHLRRAGLDGDVEVTSAGIGGWHVGEQADSRARKTLAGAGYPTEHVAAQVGQAHLDADLLVAMDSGHEAALVDLVGPDRVRMFRSFDPLADPSDLDVPDPFYGGDDGFVDVLALVERTCRRLLTEIQALDL